MTYVSGGIGKDESDAMKQAASRYSLSIEMSSPAGPRAEYVSDVKIDIRDQQEQTVISITSDGPILLAQSAAGPLYDQRRQGRYSRNNATSSVGSGVRPSVKFSFAE